MENITLKKLFAKRTERTSSLSSYLSFSLLNTPSSLVSAKDAMSGAHTYKDITTKKDAVFSSLFQKTGGLFYPDSISGEMSDFPVTMQITVLEDNRKELVLRNYSNESLYVLLLAVTTNEENKKIFIPVYDSERLILLKQKRKSVSDFRHTQPIDEYLLIASTKEYDPIRLVRKLNIYREGEVISEAGESIPLGIYTVKNN